MTLVDTLETVARVFAETVPEVDETIGERRDYGAGIGPHREPDQLAALCETAEFDGTAVTQLETEVPYPESCEACDLVVSDGDGTYAVEAKLMRFRRANGDPEPEGYARAFSPVKPSGSLISDARKLARSAFPGGNGLLSIFYDSGTEGTPASAETLATKVEQDVAFWYDMEVQTVAIERFDGLQHSVHSSGTILTWTVHSLSDRGQHSLSGFNV